MDTIHTVGIIGAGTMGSALAQKFAMEGLKVILVDRENSFLEKGLNSIRTTLEEGVSRHLFKEEDVNLILDRILTTTDLDRLASCQLVIEAVFEDLSVKQDLFRRLSSILNIETILATNTSSFSVDELSRDYACPDRFLGLHFFYHAAKNRLVEIVRGAQTSSAVFEQVFWFLQRCGKDPILCEDAHGFVVNRFFVPWLNEGVRMLEEGIAVPAEIDQVACELFGCGMGPFALMNATGIPIAYHAARTLGAQYGLFYAPATRLKQQMESREPWEIGAQIDLTAGKERLIKDRLLRSVLFVCSQLLDEDVCSAGEIHRGAAIGLRWRRTPLLLYQKLGQDSVLTLADSLARDWSLSVPKALSQEVWHPDYVQVEIRGNTGVLVLNRPEGLNALSPEVLNQLEQGFSELEQTSNVKTIVILGRGKAFMAGADIRFFIERIKGQRIHEIMDFTSRAQRFYQRIEDCPKTVIAVLNGLAFGGGLELALAADKILAVEKARLAFPETGIGIYPGLGGTQRTVRRVGKALAKYLVFTGKTLNAHQAVSMGLIDGIIAWEAIPELISNPIGFEKDTEVPPAEWEEIIGFFEQYSIEQVLNDDFPEKWDFLVKAVRSKAPRALAIAEQLIDAQAGPASELDFLEAIFSTRDALIGLESVGKAKPRFTGS